MKRFSPGQLCVKCGAGRPRIEWKRQRAEFSYTGTPLADSEYLEVTCYLCGFTDKFYPMDHLFPLEAKQAERARAMTNSVGDEFNPGYH